MLAGSVLGAGSPQSFSDLGGQGPLNPAINLRGRRPCNHVPTEYKNTNNRLETYRREQQILLEQRPREGKVQSVSWGQ